MLFNLIKVAISAVLIVIISELAKRNSLAGALIASIPVVSIIAILWIYLDTGDIELITDFSRSVFWLVIPSLIFFVFFPLFLARGTNFYISLIISLIIMIGCYLVMLKILSIIGINL